MTPIIRIRITILAAFAILYSCSPTISSTDELIKASLAESKGAEVYRLEAIHYFDTLSQQDFIQELTIEILLWKQKYDSTFQKQYQGALTHFSADHVKHLHKEKLDIENFLDSLDLVYAFLSSFINQDDFDEEYLNSCFQLQHTLDEITKVKSDIIWYGVEHSYSIKEEPFSEKLLFFPEDSTFFTADSISSHLAMYNQHQFLQNIGP